MPFSLFWGVAAQNERLHDPCQWSCPYWNFGRGLSFWWNLSSWAQIGSECPYEPRSDFRIGNMRPGQHSYLTTSHLVCMSDSLVQKDLPCTGCSGWPYHAVDQTINVLPRNKMSCFIVAFDNLVKSRTRTPRPIPLTDASIYQDVSLWKRKRKCRHTWLLCSGIGWKVVNVTKNGLYAGIRGINNGGLCWLLFLP